MYLPILRYIIFEEKLTPQRIAQSLAATIPVWCRDVLGNTCAQSSMFFSLKTLKPKPTSKHVKQLSPMRSSSATISVTSWHAARLICTLPSSSRLYLAETTDEPHARADPVPQWCQRAEELVTTCLGFLDQGKRHSSKTRTTSRTPSCDTCAQHIGRQIVCQGRGI